MDSIDGEPLLDLSSLVDFEQWLEEQDKSSRAVWLPLAKKAWPLASITEDESVDVGLCYGWASAVDAARTDGRWEGPGHGVQPAEDAQAPGAGDGGGDVLGRGEGKDRVLAELFTQGCARAIRPPGEQRRPVPLPAGSWPCRSRSAGSRPRT